MKKEEIKQEIPIPKTIKCLYRGIRLSTSKKKLSVFTKLDNDETLCFKTQKCIIGSVYELTDKGDGQFCGFKLIEPYNDKKLVDSLFAEQRLALNEYEEQKKLKILSQNKFDNQLTSLLEFVQGLSFHQRVKLGEYVKNKIIQGK